MHQDPRDPLLDPEEDPRVGDALDAIATVLTAPPDELTVQRHRRAIARARRAQPLIIAQRSLATGVAAAAMVGALAFAGALPGPVQQAAADLAARVGLELPRPSGDAVPPVDPDATPPAAEADPSDADTGHGDDDARTGPADAGTDDPALRRRDEATSPADPDHHRVPHDTPPPRSTQPDATPAPTPLPTPTETRGPSNTTPPAGPPASTPTPDPSPGSPPGDDHPSPPSTSPPPTPTPTPTPTSPPTLTPPRPAPGADQVDPGPPDEHGGAERRQDDTRSRADAHANADPGSSAEAASETGTGTRAPGATAGDRP
jgi:hypothetical protein